MESAQNHHVFEHNLEGFSYTIMVLKSAKRIMFKFWGENGKIILNVTVTCKEVKNNDMFVSSLQSCFTL